MNRRRALVLAVALLALVRPTTAQERQLTIDDIFDPARKIDFNGVTPQFSWLPDGRGYLSVNDPRRGNLAAYRKVDVKTGRDEPFVDAARLERAFAGIAGVSPARAKEIAASTDVTFNAGYTAAVVSTDDDLYYVDLGATRATRLTSSPSPETDVSFSPDGRLVSFVRDNDLYVADVATATERRLTTGGGPNQLNGRLDWVYEEEIYGRGQTGAYWWSPDSTMLAYLSLDETPVPAFVIPDDTIQDQNVEHTRYPQSGDPNPLVRLGTVAATGGATHWVDLGAYRPSDLLVVRVGWSPDSKRVLYQTQDRVQSWLELLSADPDTGKPTRVLREETKYWVDPNGMPEWLPDGTFLWLSERTGFRHVYRYGADGKLLGPVSSGEWDVRSLYGAAEGWVYFSASEHSPIANHVYRIRLDGTGMARLTDTEGDHSASFDPKFTSFIDTSSSISTPNQSSLRDSSGKTVRVVEANRVAAFSQFKLGTPEFVTVPTRDGFQMEALMIKPPGFDPSKKYPVLSYTYAGPGAQSVRNAWGRQTYMWHQMIAQRGYIIWICDNRQASNKGVRTSWTSFRNMGEPELRDLEDGVSWLKKQPYVDGERIGLWGWSYGGFMTSFALTHSTSFKIGIAGAPVTDWRNYDSVYTERYMGLPGENPEGYDRNSVVKAAANLHGKLLLIHGAIDDNVHLQNSIQLIDALQKAGKQFQFMIYPKSRHGVTDPMRLKHLRTTMAEFIFNNL